MNRMNRSRVTLLTPLVMACCFLFSIAISSAQTGGEITGQVQNAGTGNYLNNARVAVTGTNLETFTDASGRYQLTNVPAGATQLVVSYAGFRSQTADVQVSGRAVQNFELMLEDADFDTRNKVVVMDKFTVSGRILSGQAQALNEQKNAPIIKTVVSLDQFPDMGEGNVGEFLKYVPGIALNYNPQTPAEASIRGMPSSGTLVTLDGMSLASSGANGRAYDLAQASIGNVDRVEVTKAPTPDMPANAVGGGVNIISKSGFSRKTPLLTYNVFGTYTSTGGVQHLSSDSMQVARPDGGSSVLRVQPSYNLSYLLPLNDKLAFTFALSQSIRYNDWDTLRPVWDKVRLVQSSAQITHAPLEERKFLASASAEWRINPGNTLRFSAQRTKQHITLRQNSLVSIPGAGSTVSTDSNGLMTTQSASSVGSISEAFGWNNQYKPLTLFTGSYKFQHDKWTFDLGGSYSKAGIDLLDSDDGFFSNIGAAITTLSMRHEGDNVMDRRLIPAITATRAGVPVAIFDGANYTVNTATTSNRRIDDEVSRVAFNLARDMGGPANLTIKVGGAVERRKVGDTSAARTFTFTPPGGAAAKLAGGYDIIDNDFSAGSYFTDSRGQDVNVRFLSPTKLYNLYQANPSWFVLNDSAAYIAKVNATKALTETISAGYIRADAKLFHNRLWLVAGVRFEKTNDDGYGPRDEIRATYQKDASGNLILGSNGLPVPITTNALDSAKLRYTQLGTHIEKSYDDFYPSVNVTYSITDKLIVRAAYAKTIGRPNFTEVIPGVVATDPAAAPDNRIVTVVNTGLKPWTANNYDLSIEAYGIKGAVASVSVFRKELSDFFGSTRQDATPELLAEFGLGDEYLTYDIVTKRNAGDAALNGVELSYRQSFDQIHPWGRGLQVYANITAMRLSGPNKADLTNFVPFTINYGVSYTRAKFRGDVSVSQFNERRIQPGVTSASVTPNSYIYNSGQTKVDVSLEYRFTRLLSVYGSARNLFAQPLRRGTWSDTIPEYARVDQYQYTGAMFTLGIKGSF